MSAPVPSKATPGVPLASGFAVFCMLVWSTPPVIARAMSESVPPIALAYSRWVIAMLVLLPIVWRKLHSHWPQWRKHWKSLVLLAFFMVAGSSLSTVAAYFTTATNVVLVNASQPTITALIGFFVAGTALRSVQIAGIGCAFSGILIMICRGDIDVLLTLDIAIGDPIMLVAVIGWSLYAVNLHRGEYAPSGDILLFMISLVGVIAMLPLAVAEYLLVGGFEPRPVFFGAMIYMALFPTLLATYFWNRAIGALGANRAAIFINLIPVFGSVLAMLVLDEALFRYHLVGAALVFCGIMLAVRRVSR